MSGSGDYISREAALRDWPLCDEPGDAYQFIRNFPAADVRPHWIPVTERLPETSGVYLAWMQWDLTDPDDNPSAYPIEYDAEEEAFGWWKQYFDPESLGWAGEEFIRYEGVTHWMPLPEPPKEGME